MLKIINFQSHKGKLMKNEIESLNFLSQDFLSYVSTVVSSVDYVGFDGPGGGLSHCRCRSTGLPLLIPVQKPPTGPSKPI